MNRFLYIEPFFCCKGGGGDGGLTSYSFIAPCSIVGIVQQQSLSLEFTMLTTPFHVWCECLFSKWRALKTNSLNLDVATA